MAFSRKLKPVDAKNTHKLEKYFPVVAQKRKLNENSSSHDENRRKTPSPPSSQQKPEKRQFGEVKKNGGLKEKHVRVPLGDKNPQKPLISTVPKTKAAPKFAVLCDEDIQKGVEKAPTPPNISPYNSQEETNSKSEKELNTQVIPEPDSQWTDLTGSSPIQLVEDGFTQDNDDTHFEIYQDEQEFSTTQNDELPFEIFKDNDNEDEEEDDDDLFVKTKDSTLKFEPVKLEKSLLSLSGSFFSEGDNNEDSKSTESNFFSDHTDDGGFTIGGDEFSFVNSEIEISLSDISSIPPAKTLSQEPESVSQIILPCPNPRGNDILEKLNLKKVTQEEDADDDDGLPIF